MVYLGSGCKFGFLWLYVVGVEDFWLFVVSIVKIEMLDVEELFIFFVVWMGVIFLYGVVVIIYKV